MKRIGISLTLVGLVALIGGGAAMFSGSSSARGTPQGAASEDPPILGTDLAESLGLSPVTSYPVTDCHYFAEARDLETGAVSGYCLDGVVEDDRSFMEMAIMFRGRIPTSIDERIFELQEQLTQLPDGQTFDAQRAAIAAEITALQT